MNIEVAINLVDTLYFQKNNQHINSVQINLLRGVWLNYSYEEIANTCYCSVSNVKMVGAEFWKELSQMLGEKVTKKTARAILESYHQDRKQGKLRKTRIKTEIEDLSAKNKNIKINSSTPTFDPWFSSEKLEKLTIRLDHYLNEITATPKADIKNINDLSEKIKLLHDLSVEKYNINRKSLDIIDMCRHLINSFETDFSQHQIILSLFNEPILPHYDLMINTLIDKKLVHNILKYLLTNALIYSDPKTLIKLDINIEDEKGIFTIEDQGIGIPSDELEYIFKSFYCGSNAKEKCGDGLGLTIVEKSVRLHQGEISLSSQIGQGSIFTVVLPIA